MARRRISGRELSARTGITEASLSRKLNAISGWTVSELMAVGDALSTPASELIARALARAEIEAVAS